MTIWQERIKRAMDVVGAAVGLLFLGPAMLIVAMVICAIMGRPVLFRQKRPGLHGKPFALIKFRTMESPREGEDAARTDGQRLTRLGRLLRKTSVDELPELWNVLVGDLSLVGPRPLLMQYLPYFSEREMQRHSVRPGITGWAQIHGRNETSWEDRFRADLWYVENWSLALDIRILLITLCQCVRRANVVVDARSLMANLDEERAASRKAVFHVDE